MDNKSAALQPLKKKPSDLHPNNGILQSFRGGCDRLTWWCAGVLSSSVSGMLCIPAGIWKQDASLSPVRRAKNASHLQVLPAQRPADNFYFTLKCKLGRDSHQQLCFKGRKASPCPCMGMFNIPAQMWGVHGTHMWTNTCSTKLRVRILFAIFINSLQQDWFKRAVINVYLHTKFMTVLFPLHHHFFLT